MDVLQAFRLGVRKTNQAKRIIFFAWLVNTALAMTVVLPMLSRLDDYIGDTVMEEQLLEQIDANWLQTFKEDYKDNDLVGALDYTIFGAAPFLVHYDSYLSGSVIRPIGRFFFDLIFRLRIGFEYLGPLTILAFLYVLASTFLASGFVGMFAKDYRLSFQEFLIEGAKYFGRFFRLSVLSLIVYMIVFGTLLDWWAQSIPLWTANERSEMVPFVHYMIKNGTTVLLLGFLTLCFDYAKIRIVLEDRLSGLFASWAGLKFVLQHFFPTTGLYLFLSLIGIAAILFTVSLQGMVHPSGYWTILFVFLIQQVYLGVRLWVRALFYASQTQLAQRHLRIQGLSALR
ncbi:MAG: hypothetical protein HYW57_08670 [Ignavibacteriales bacterium]|nr:hypothetical protein [Ignavibacteriales bacterium]